MYKSIGTYGDFGDFGDRYISCLTWPCNADRYALGSLDCAGIAITGLHNLTFKKGIHIFSEMKGVLNKNATKI